MCHARGQRLISECLRVLVQALVVFTSLELLCAMLSSCGAACLLLFHHLQCRPTDVPSVTSEARQPPWLRCANLSWMLAASALVVAYFSGTASVALSLRLRIQKTGKRNLNWNQGPQRWKERNVRRGGSHALRALTNGKDAHGDDDMRIKCVRAASPPPPDVCVRVPSAGRSAVNGRSARAWPQCRCPAAVPVHGRSARRHGVTPARARVAGTWPHTTVGTSSALWCFASRRWCVVSRRGCCSTYERATFAMAATFWAPRSICRR